MLLFTSAAYKAPGTTHKKYTLARMSLAATGEHFVTSVLSDVYTNLTAEPSELLVNILSERLGRYVPILFRHYRVMVKILFYKASGGYRAVLFWQAGGRSVVSKGCPSYVW